MDPNAVRKAQLAREIEEAIKYVSQDALAVEKAKQRLESSISRFNRLTEEVWTCTCTSKRKDERKDGTNQVEGNHPRMGEGHRR